MPPTTGGKPGTPGNKIDSKAIIVPVTKTIPEVIAIRFKTVLVSNFSDIFLSSRFYEHFFFVRICAFSLRLPTAVLLETSRKPPLGEFRDSDIQYNRD